MKNDLSVQMIIYMLAAAAVACVFSYVLTPLVKRLAVRLHAVDVPKDARRMHTRAVPQLGGLAIAVSAFVVAGAAIWLLGSHGLGGVELGGLESLALLVSFLIILSLGIVDDIVSLRASVKFLIQTVAALLVVLVGDLHIDILSVSLGRMGWLALPLGWLSYPVTMLWLLTLTNGYNFIDGIDGLACGTGCISSFSLLGIALLTGNTTVAVIFAALGGACLGFLPHNAHPAKVFMGDTGATFLGFVFGTLSIPVLFVDQPKLPFLVPAMVFSLPLFDLCYAIIRRVRKGVSPFTADRGHFHHRLIDHGYSVWKTAAISWGFTAIECLAAVVAAGNTDLRPAALIIGLVVFITFACHIIRCGQKGS